MQCFEIRVTMTDEFFSEYKSDANMGKSKSMYLYTGNPNKFLAVQYLIHEHAKRGDKILVFIDSIDILVEFAKTLRYPFICGDMKHSEREKLLQFFQVLPNWNVLFVSRVGDVGIDLPDANVAIEVSSQFGSRRQEAQRLGRILRPKESTKDRKIQSYFYSLVSIGTEEVKYAIKRQKFLVKQGYSFKITKETELPYHRNPQMRHKFKMSHKEEQLKFLEKLMSLSLRKENQAELREAEKEEMMEEAPDVSRRRLQVSSTSNTYFERNIN